MIQIVTLYDIKLVFVQKITFVLRKIDKNCCHQSCTFDSSFVVILTDLNIDLTD